MSLTRRQLLLRTGGATVALAWFGALPGGAVADPSELSAARRSTFAALLGAINEDPAYVLADREARVGLFATRYADEALRPFADAVLDTIPAGFAELAPADAHAELLAWEGALRVDALALAAVPYLDDDSDGRIPVFSV